MTEKFGNVEAKTPCLEWDTFSGQHNQAPEALSGSGYPCPLRNFSGNHISPVSLCPIILLSLPYQFLLRTLSEEMSNSWGERQVRMKG